MQSSDSFPIASMVYRTEPVQVTDLCLTQEFLGADSLPIRGGDRVSHTRYGPGRVTSLGHISEQRVQVEFETGKMLFLPSRELFHP